MYTHKINFGKYEVFYKRQFFRFLLVGIFNTSLAYGIYALALAVGFSYPVANFIALAMGIIISFTTQGRVVFYSPEYHRFWRFLLCWTILYCVNIAIIRKLIHIGFDPYLAGALALPVVVMLSFVIQKYFVFNRQNATYYFITSRFPK